MKIENSYFNCNNISQYYCFYGIFDQISAALVTKRDFFQLTPSFWTVVHIKINWFTIAMNELYANDSPSKMWSK